MPSITDKFGKSSIDNNYAIATTVKTTRTVGVTVLECFDLSKFNPDTPVFVVTYKKTTDPVTGIVSVTNLVSWKALVNTGANTLTNLTVAPGYADLGNAVGDFVECIPTSYWENSLIDGILTSLKPDGTLKDGVINSDSLFTDATSSLLARGESFNEFIVPGGAIWSNGGGLNATFSAGIAYVKDANKKMQRLVVAAVASRTFTASRDTYIFLNSNNTITYSEVANNATPPAKPANSILIALIVTDGSTISLIYDMAARQPDELGRCDCLYGSPTRVFRPHLLAARNFTVEAGISISAGTVGTIFRLNNDTGGNYAFIVSTDLSGTAGSASSSNAITVSNGTQSNPALISIAIQNAAANLEKMVRIQQHHRGSPGAGSLPSSRDIYGKWANTTDSVNRIDLISSGTGTYTVSGSYMVVKGTPV